VNSFKVDIRHERECWSLGLSLRKNSFAWYYIVFKHLYSASSGVNVQKRCQCARPYEKNSVSRDANEDERLPERKVECTEGESVFQREGPIEAKDRDRAKAVLLLRTKRSSLFKE